MVSVQNACTIQNYASLGPLPPKCRSVELHVSPIMPVDLVRKDKGNLSAYRVRTLIDSGAGTNWCHVDLLKHVHYKNLGSTTMQVQVFEGCVKKTYKYVELSYTVQGKFGTFRCFVTDQYAWFNEVKGLYDYASSTLSGESVIDPSSPCDHDQGKKEIALILGPYASHKLRDREVSYRYEGNLMFECYKTGNKSGFVFSGLLPKHLNEGVIYSYSVTPRVEEHLHAQALCHVLSVVEPGLCYDRNKPSHQELLWGTHSLGAKTQVCKQTDQVAIIFNHFDSVKWDKEFMKYFFGILLYDRIECLKLDKVVAYVRMLLLVMFVQEATLMENIPKLISLAEWYGVHERLKVEQVVYFVSNTVISMRLGAHLGCMDTYAHQANGIAMLFYTCVSDKLLRVSWHRYMDVNKFFQRRIIHSWLLWHNNPTGEILTVEVWQCLNTQRLMRFHIWRRSLEVDPRQADLSTFGKLLTGSVCYVEGRVLYVFGETYIYAISEVNYFVFNSVWYLHSSMPCDGFMHVCSDVKPTNILTFLLNTWYYSSNMDVNNWFMSFKTSFPVFPAVDIHVYKLMLKQTVIVSEFNLRSLIYLYVYDVQFLPQSQQMACCRVELSILYLGSAVNFFSCSLFKLCLVSLDAGGYLEHSRLSPGLITENCFSLLSMAYKCAQPLLWYIRGFYNCPGYSYAMHGIHKERDKQLHVEVHAAQSSDQSKQVLMYHKNVCQLLLGEQKLVRCLTRF